MIDLRIDAGKIVAKVSGSSLYDVAIDIDAVQGAAWRAIQRECAGSIGSRIDLLSGKLSEPVMARLCADRTGLFPAPSAIRFTCSCPDYATMCKHVAAVMYGVGARLDRAPDLLFTLRRVSADELHAAALSELPAAPSKGRVLAAAGLATLFGIELAEPAATVADKPVRRRTSPARTAAEPARAAKVPPLARSTTSSRKPRTRSATADATNATPSTTNPGPRAKQLTIEARTPARQAGTPARQARTPAPRVKASAPRVKASAPPATTSARPAKASAGPAKAPAGPAKQPAPKAKRRSR